MPSPFARGPLLTLAALACTLMLSACDRTPTAQPGALVRSAAQIYLPPVDRAFTVERRKNGFLWIGDPGGGGASMTAYGDQKPASLPPNTPWVLFAEPETVAGPHETPAVRVWIFDAAFQDVVLMAVYSRDGQQNDSLGTFGLDAMESLNAPTEFRDAVRALRAEQDISSQQGKK